MVGGHFADFSRTSAPHTPRVANLASEALDELERQLPLFGDTRVVDGNGIGLSNRACLTPGEAARIIREAVKDKS